jgi:Leucine-rich repeat (LRR) protein
MFVLLGGSGVPCCGDDPPLVGGQEAASRKTLEAKLDVLVDLTADNVPLQTYLEDLAREHGFELGFDGRQIAAQSIPLDRPISGNVRGLSLQAGLARLLKRYGLAPRIEGKVLVIGTMAPQPVARPGPMRGRVVERNLVVNARARRMRVLMMNDQFKATLFNPLFRREVDLPVEDQEDGQLEELGEAHRRQIAREHFYESFEWRDTTAGMQKRLQEMLAGQIQRLSCEWDLSDLQQRKLKLAGQGDIERVIARAEAACDQYTATALTGVRLIEIPSSDFELLYAASSSSFEEIIRSDSMFEKVRERILTEEQRAVGRAVVHLRSTGGIVRTRPSEGQGIREVFLALRPLEKPSLTHLAALKKLEHLSLSSTTIEDHDLGQLKDLKNLKALDLSMTVIGDAGLVHLEEFNRLEDLDLRQTNVSDAGLTSLQKMRNLRRLDLSETACTGAGLRNLRGLVHLESLNLSGLGITDESLELLSVREMVNLRELRLSCASLGKKGLAALSQLRQLERLELNGVNLSETGLEPLADLTALRVLFLDRSEIGDDDLGALSKLSNLERLDMQRTHITNHGLSHLKDLKQLRTLDLWGAEATKEGTRDLEAAIPQLRIIR